MRLLREVLALAGLLCQLVVVWTAWPAVPSRVPTHFGITGRPDAFGDKSSLFLLPTVTVALYTLLTVLSFFPQTFNYPVRVTDENRTRLHALGVSLLGWLKAELVWIFACLCSNSIAVAEGRAAGLSPAFLVISLGAVAVTTCVVVVRMRREAAD